MAWVRTATSLISFGFTIYKFFQFELSKEEVHRATSQFGPRRFGMVMIVIGIVSLVAAQVQDYFNRKELAKQYGPGPFSVAAVVAVLVGGSGCWHCCSPRSRSRTLRRCRGRCLPFPGPRTPSRW